MGECLTLNNATATSSRIFPVNYSLSSGYQLSVSYFVERR